MVPSPTRMERAPDATTSAQLQVMVSGPGNRRDLPDPPIPIVGKSDFLRGSPNVIKRERDPASVQQRGPMCKQSL